MINLYTAASMKTIVILVVILAFVATFSEACTCGTGHPQKEFCSSDFVIRARVLGRRIEEYIPDFENVIYTVEIYQDYKRRQYPIRRRTRLEIYTALPESCGASFLIGREYIISGSIRNNRLSTNSCNWNRLTSSLTQFQRNALNSGVYRNNCYCNIRYCGFTDDPTCTYPRRNECLIFDNADCFNRNDACIYYERRCNWYTNQCAYRPPF